MPQARIVGPLGGRRARARDEERDQYPPGTPPLLVKTARVGAAGYRRRTSLPEDPAWLLNTELRTPSQCPAGAARGAGMQRRRVHGLLADPQFNPRAIMEDEYVRFDKHHEAIDTIVT